MRKLLLLCWVLLCTVSTWAAQRSSEEALEIARSFFAQYPTTRSAADIRLVAVSGDLLKPASTRTASDSPAFFVYNHGQAAYVVVSGDDRMRPVLGYSDAGAFVTENLPSNILWWLEEYQSVYAALNAGTPVVKEPHLMTRATFPETVEPLLGEIAWNQSAPYNNSCPLVQGQRSVTGCVATAMAMIMKYHNYPEKGTGSHTYTTQSGSTYSFNFGNTTFDWDNMIPQYVSGSYTTEQATAVATLMHACGVAVEMQYSPSSSGASTFSVGQGIIDFFNYDENVSYIERECFTTEEWMNLIKTEISQGRPIYYSGVSKDVGHAFVFDGYDAQGMVHVNWGWGGMNNGYFEVASLDPENPGIGGGTNLGGGFIYSQGMLIGIQPPTDSSQYTSHFRVGELSVSKQEVTKGETFDLTASLVYNMSTTFKKGILALIAEKDGKQNVLGGGNIENLRSGYGYENLTLSDLVIPNELSDGTYSLYLATKEEREISWSRARGGYGWDSQFTLTISGNACKIVPFAGNLSVQEDLDGSIELLHNLYTGYSGDFKMLISNKNTTNEFYGEVGVLFFTAEEDPQFLGWIGATQLELQPGARDRELFLSGSLISNLTDKPGNIPAGEYYICPGATWGKYVYTIGEQYLNVTVKAATSGSPKLVAENARLEKTQLQVGDNLKLMADFSLNGRGDVYDETLLAAIFQVGQASTSNLHYAKVFIEKSEPFAFEMEINPQVGVGDYEVRLCSPGLLGKYDVNKPLCKLAFSVSPSTGIEEEAADKEEGIIIRQQPVEDVLYISTGADARMITVYNLSGQQMIQWQADGENTGKEYAVPVEGLAAGYYLVTLQTAEGKVYRSKFIKK